VKLLLREPVVLILDEPTSLLSPAQQQKLFERLRIMRDGGKAVIFVSHKLPEVMAHSDRVSVMRRGRLVKTVVTRETSVGRLARLVAGEALKPVPAQRTRAEGAVPGEALLVVRGLGLLPGKRAFDLEVHRGEILGVATVAGGGELELAEFLVGVRKAGPGRLFLNGVDIGAADIRRRREMGLRHIGPDVDSTGIIGRMSVHENALLGVPAAAELSNPFRIDRTGARRRVRKLVEAFDIETPDFDVEVQALSGGNRQKLAVARETAEPATLVVAVEPARGLDIRGVAILIDRLRQVTQRGGAAVVAAYDVDALVEIADRIAVLYDGELAGVVPRDEARTETLIELMMGGADAR